MQENYTSLIAADNMGRALDEQLQAIVVMYNYNFEKGERQFQKNRDDFYFWYESVVSVFTKIEKDIIDSLNIEYQQFLKDINDNIDYNIYRAEKRQTLRSDFVKFVDQIQAIKNKQRHLRD